MTVSSRRIGDRYVLGPDLASGGMATVHLGKQLGAEGFHRIVALKKLHGRFSADADIVDSFLAEAKVAASIRHPNVVAIQDVVREGDELFLVMDYVPGLSLARLMGGAETVRKVPPAIASAVLLNVLEGLEAAHGAAADDGTPLRLVHRDISPQNILVGADGAGRLIDFGVARSAARLKNTREGLVKGKLLYLPPEVVEGEAHGIAGDVFSAGAVLWEALVGKPVFAAETDGAITARILVGDVSPPSRSEPSVSEALDAVVLKALEHSARKRWKSAAEFAAALRVAAPPAPAAAVRAWLAQECGPTLEERSGQVRAFEMAALPDVALPARASLVATEELETRPKPRRHASAYGTTALVALLVAGGAALLSSRLRSESDLREAPASDAHALATARVDAMAPAAPLEASVLPAASAPPSPSAGGASTADAALGHEAGVVGAIARPAALPRPAPSASAQKSLDCRVPYRLDSEGNRIYRRECLQ